MTREDIPKLEISALAILKRIVGDKGVVGGGENPDYCPICHAFEYLDTSTEPYKYVVDHEGDCELAALLAVHQEEGQGK